MKNIAGTAYVCPACDKEFPFTYHVKNTAPHVQQSGKRRGTKQLMKLHAHNNYERHVRACWFKRTGVRLDKRLTLRHAIQSTHSV